LESDIEIKKCKFEDIYSVHPGGSCEVRGTVLVENTVFRNCSSPMGGAICASGAGKVAAFVHCEFYDSWYHKGLTKTVKSNRLGGAVAGRLGVTLVITESVFEANLDGCVATFQCVCVVSYSVFRSNGGRFSGIFLYGASNFLNSLMLTYCDFLDNAGNNGKRGDCVWAIDFSMVSIFNCLFHGCSGPALVFSVNGTVELGDCSFRNGGKYDIICGAPRVISVKSSLCVQNVGSISGVIFDNRSNVFSHARHKCPDSVLNTAGTRTDLKKVKPKSVIDVSRIVVLAIIGGVAVASFPRRKIESRKIRTGFLAWGVLLLVFFTDYEPECPEIEFAAKDPLHKRGLTFVSVPRPLAQETECVRFRTAIASWLASHWSTKVVLFVNRSEFCFESRLADELDKIWGSDRIGYVGPCEGDSHGIPYIRSWFRDGARFATTEYVAMINSDIIVSSAWVWHTTEIFKRSVRKSKLFVVTPRHDVGVPFTAIESLYFCKDSFLLEVDQMVREYRPAQHDWGGMDIFTFYRPRPPINFSAMPPFLMGRPAWDLWLAGWANTLCETVSTTHIPPVYHLNHAVHHRSHTSWDVVYNLGLAIDKKGYFATTFHMKWYARNGELFSNRKYKWEVGRVNYLGRNASIRASERRTRVR
jgi:hypothetical protein